MSDDTNKDKAAKCGPRIVFTKNSPYMVVDMDNIVDHRLKPIKISHVASLCRCGQSSNQPFCDGTHAKINFSGEKQKPKYRNKVRRYEGKEITILDNRSVCSHDGSCMWNLPRVFRRGRSPWIIADNADKNKIIETIKMCPSGALSYELDGVIYSEQERPPRIKVTLDGPLEVTGHIELDDDQGTQPECHEHYTLCRCGHSSNKPFCDGEHLELEDY
jgi:CDGSH-type Zn-finger protein